MRSMFDCCEVNHGKPVESAGKYKENGAKRGETCETQDRFGFERIPSQKQTKKQTKQENGIHVLSFISYQEPITLFLYSVQF